MKISNKIFLIKSHNGNYIKVKKLNNKKIKEEKHKPDSYAKWIVEETSVTCSGCQRCYDSDFEIKKRMVLSFKFCPDCGRKIIK